MVDQEKDKDADLPESEQAAQEQASSPGPDYSQEVGEGSEIEELRAQLAAKELEAQQHHEQFLRQVAELENYKKRVSREKQDALRYANEALVRDLLPVLDNLERATEHAQGGGNGQPLLEGIEMVLKGFLEALEKHGVTQVSARGQAFDPEKHEAYAQIESDTCEPNTVVDEVHKGYYLFDRLLRPSLVSVSKSSNEKDNDEKES